MGEFHHSLQRKKIESVSGKMRDLICRKPQRGYAASKVCLPNTRLYSIATHLTGKKGEKRSDSLLPSPKIRQASGERRSLNLLPRLKRLVPWMAMPCKIGVMRRTRVSQPERSGTLTVRSIRVLGSA
jgi:hypothetical protein